MHANKSINWGLVSRVLEDLNRVERPTLNKKGESYSQKKEISELSLKEQRMADLCI